MQGLSGVRVLEIGEHVAVPYAGKLLADLGANVIKIEPPAGDRSRRHGPFPPAAANDPEQSGLFLALNTNKRSRVLDLGDPASSDTIAELVAQADLVLHDLSAAQAAALGLDADSVTANHRALVVCAITPFGQVGPHAEWLGHEINVVHGGGWGWLIPGAEPDPTAPPLTVFGHPANFQAGMAGAMAALASHHKARTTGIGDIIDLSAMAQVSAMLEAAFIAWSYRGEVAGRSGGRMLNPWNIYPCADGLIFMVTVEQDQWLRLVDMMGNPEWAELDVFATFEDRAANQDVLNVYIEEFTRQHRVEDLFHQGQQQRICFAPVFTMADLEGQEHLRDRGFFATASHEVAGELTYMGAPYSMTPDRWSLRTTAPTLGQHDSAVFGPDRDTSATPVVNETRRSARPLEGIRVVDFTWVWAGPYATMHLGFLGAEVIKVESSARPGLGRRLPVMASGVPETLNTCGYFNQWDQGKKSIELDLSDPGSLPILLDLIGSADVVVDNYATGVMDRLGLSDEVLRGANPDLIIASVTGFGHTGPLKNYMGYGPTTAPLSGLTSMTGHVDGGPEEAGISFGDPAAGLTAAFAIVAAVFARDRGDEPARIDVSLWEATAVNAADSWMGHVLGAPVQEPIGSRHPNHAPHGVFRCAGDDVWVSIACMSDEQWQSMAATIDDDMATSLCGDARFVDAHSRKLNEAELEAAVTDWASQRDSWAVTRDLQDVGVAAYPSLSSAELEVNEQHIARDFWQRLDHPEAGPRTHSGVSWRAANAPSGSVSRAPLLGEHTAEVLAALRAPHS